MRFFFTSQRETHAFAVDGNRAQALNRIHAQGAGLGTRRAVTLLSTHPDKHLEKQLLSFFLISTEFFLIFTFF